MYHETWGRVTRGRSLCHICYKQRAEKPLSPVPELIVSGYAIHCKPGYGKASMGFHWDMTNEPDWCLVRQEGKIKVCQKV